MYLVYWLQCVYIRINVLLNDTILKYLISYSLFSQHLLFAVLVSVIYRPYIYLGGSVSTVHHYLWSDSFCGVLVLGETIAHCHFCVAAANMLTLAAISPRQTILGMCCYTDSLTSRHFQLQSYISEWWRCCSSASLAWFAAKQGLCAHPVSSVNFSALAQLIGVTVGMWVLICWRCRLIWTYIGLKACAAWERTACHLSQVLNCRDRVQVWGRFV